jgi:hypothetical protein
MNLCCRVVASRACQPCLHSIICFSLQPSDFIKFSICRPSELTSEQRRCGHEQTLCSLACVVCCTPQKNNSSLHSPPVSLQSFWTLTASHIGGFLNYLDMVGLLGQVISPSQGLYLQGQHNTERRGQTSMPKAGFEPTIPATNRPRPTPQTARPLWPATLHFS